MIVRKVIESESIIFLQKNDDRLNSDGHEGPRTDALMCCLVVTIRGLVGLPISSAKAKICNYQDVRLKRRNGWRPLRSLGLGQKMERELSTD